MTLTSGVSSSGDGGDLALSSGGGSDSGGAVQVTGGSGSVSTGGSIFLSGGSSYSATGGNIYLKPGSGSSSGSIYFESATSSTNIGVLSDSHFEISVSSVVDIESSSSLDLTSGNGMTLSSTNGVDLDSGYISGYEYSYDESMKNNPQYTFSLTMNTIGGQFMIEPVALYLGIAQSSVTIYNNRASAGDMIVTQIVNQALAPTCWDLHILYARCDTNGVVEILVSNNIEGYCAPNIRVQFLIMKH